jgi:hypothetical protein
MAKDKQLVAKSAKQRHEVDYIVTRYGVPRELVKRIVAKTRSRVIVYALLRLSGYVIPGKHPQRLQNKICELGQELGLTEWVDQKFLNNVPK